MYKILVIILVIILCVYLLNNKNINIEGFRSLYNTVYYNNDSGQVNNNYGPFIKPPTHLIFNNRGEYITMLDMLPSLNLDNKFKPIVCPANYDDSTVNRFHDKILCWQYL
jgi:hypothetical protein